MVSGADGVRRVLVTLPAHLWAEIRRRRAAGRIPGRSESAALAGLVRLGIEAFEAEQIADRLERAPWWPDRRAAQREQQLMGENSKIEWTDNTFNPWVGCTKVSPACDGCYAESWARRTGHPELWEGERRQTSPANWRQPIKWNREAAAAGRRARVFCASLADVFDNRANDEWRRDLWSLIVTTPALDWLLLTKRPQNAAKMLPYGFNPEAYPNVWLGTTVENQEEADRRIPHLLALPARVRFLSCEPLLGPVRLDRVEHQTSGCGGPVFMDTLRGTACSVGGRFEYGKIDWVIAGGESGPKARASHPDWFRSLRDQCAAAEVPFFFKQWGEWHPCTMEDGVCYQFDGAAPFDSWKTRIFDPDQETGINYRHLGKKRAGRLLDGVAHDAVPT